MKRTSIGLYFGMLVLILSAACAPGNHEPTATPTYSAVLINPHPIINAAPACTPPVPSISNINSFCANQAAGLGGATWTQFPSDEDPSVAMDAAFINNYSANPDCNWNQSKVACSGPQDAKVTYQLCTSCGASNSVEPQAYNATFGPNVCTNGYVKDNNGACVPANKNNPPYYGICPAGTHYDNSLQNCADDVTNQLASPCPPGYPYLLPVYRLCLAKALPVVYNCQLFTIQLGECIILQKKPGVVVPSCPAGTTWNGSCCENVDHRCQ